MQLFIGRQLFIFAMYFFHARIGKAMFRSMEYYAETMRLISVLFPNKKQRADWESKAHNLMVSYADDEFRRVMKEMRRG